MKIIFLLPPSEGKNSENLYKSELLSFNFEKPLEIANNVTEKDLKCSWKRFLEWLELNKNIKIYETIEAIKRYSWVMFNAIDYSEMNSEWKKYFENNFKILSWMYWVVNPLDKIGNYKLPVETKWLYDFWWDLISNELINQNPDYIVNLLPISYWKLIWFWTWPKQRKKLELITEAWIKVININFLKPDWKKISHWVKKIKWEWIKNICENKIIDILKFWGKIIESKNIIDVNIVYKK